MNGELNQEFRCGQCNRLLAMGWARDAHLVHKCPRCGTFNTLRVLRPGIEPQDGQQGESLADRRQSIQRRGVM